MFPTISRSKSVLAPRLTGGHAPRDLTKGSNWAAAGTISGQRWVRERFQADRCQLDVLQEHLCQIRSAEVTVRSRLERSFIKCLGLVKLTFRQRTLLLWQDEYHNLL